jgi:hypothetical protein
LQQAEFKSKIFPLAASDRGHVLLIPEVGDQQEMQPGKEERT